MAAPGSPSSSIRKIGQTEFLALMAMLFATIAFSTDAMLPALPAIEQALTPEAPNRAQLIVTSFLFGMGFGTLITGPLSDTFGRKPTIIAFASLYIGGALLAWIAPSLELVLAARVIQGIGAAGPRVVGIAIVRDLYSGREMARLMSFIFIVFSLFPAIAPLIGEQVIALAGWRAIFLVFVVFIATSTLWLAIRQPETLPPERRTPFSLPILWTNIKIVLANRTVRFTVAVQVFVMAQLFTMVSTTQPVFERLFDKGESFTLWFAFIAVCAGTSSFVNARYVMRVGMRGMVTRALIATLVVSAVCLATTSLIPLPETLFFGIYLFWVVMIFFQMGLTMGNLNTLALEPMGAMAGTASSVIGALATALSVLVAAPIGLMFTDSIYPLVLGCMICGVIALSLMLRMGAREEEPENTQ